MLRTAIRSTETLREAARRKTPLSTSWQRATTRGLRTFLRRLLRQQPDVRGRRKYDATACGVGESALCSDCAAFGSVCQAGGTCAARTASSSSSSSSGSGAFSGSSGSDASGRRRVLPRVVPDRLLPGRVPAHSGSSDYRCRYRRQRVRGLHHHPDALPEPSVPLAAKGRRTRTRGRSPTDWHRRPRRIGLPHGATS